MPEFASQAWFEDFVVQINASDHYREVAADWEGDIAFRIMAEPDRGVPRDIYGYLDLWHGTCRKVAMLPAQGEMKPEFVLTATYDNIVDILTGKLNPMTAMMTRKLQVHGNMAMMMRNVPTVLDFVRCAREVTTEIL